jgi:sulfite reductase alpha subunit-like flavoprotein
LHTLGYYPKPRHALVIIQLIIYTPLITTVYKTTPYYFLYIDISYQRFYSISSSPQAHPGEIHATVAVVRFKKESKFLQRLLFV